MRIALNSLRNILVRSLTVGFLLLLAVLTGRLLGPEGRGVYALVTLFSSIGVALLGGMGTAVGHWISSRGERVPDVVASAAVLALLAGTAALGCTLLAYFLIGLVTGEGPRWLVVVGAAQPGVLVAAALTWAFLGADDHRRYSLAILAPSLLTLLLMAPVMLVFRGDTTPALLAWVAAQYAVVLWLWRLGRSVWTPLPLERVSMESMRALAAFSLVTGLANVVSILNLRADALFIERMLGTAQLGVYAQAVQLVEGLTFVSQAVGVALWARVGAADRSEAEELIARGLRYTLALMAAGGLVLVALAGVGIPLLFGDAFRGAVTPFRVFVPGVVVWGMAGVLATYYTNSRGRPRVPLAIAGISLAITVVLCPLLVAAFGLTGGALTTTIAYSSAVAVGLWLFCRDSGIPLYRAVLLSREDIGDALGLVHSLAGRARGAANHAPASGTQTEATPRLSRTSEPVILHIGRAQDNDIVLFDHSVAPFHLEVWKQDGQFMVKDLGTRNGTFIDGQRISECAVPSTATLRLGPNATVHMADIAKRLNAGRQVEHLNVQRSDTSSRDAAGAPQPLFRRVRMARPTSSHADDTPVGTGD